MALQVWQLAAIEVIYPNGGNGGSSGGGGGGGASASNYIFTPTLETWYPNSTAYEARPLVNVFLESASAANAIAVFEVDTNADNTADLSYRQLLTKVGADNVANSAWFTYSVLPGWQWRVTDASSGGGTVSIDATAPNGNGIWYYATNGGTGGGSGDVTAAGLASGNYPVAGSSVTGSVNNSATANSLSYSSNAPLTGQLNEQWPLPVLGFDTWSTWQASFHNYRSNTVERWITNLANTINTNGLAKKMDAVIWIDDGWMSPTLDAQSNLTWDANIFPDSLTNVIKKCAAKGVGIILYSSRATNVCSGLPGSPINLVYQHVQRMMSWGAVGCFFDSCDNTIAEDIQYSRAWARLAQQAVLDYQSAIYSTGGVVRPFYIVTATGNGAENYPSQISVPDFMGFNAVSWNWTDQTSSLTGYVYQAKETLKYLGATLKPGRYADALRVYTPQMVDGEFLRAGLATMAMTCQQLRIGAGDSLIGEWGVSNHVASTYDYGYSNWQMTNSILPILGNQEFVNIWRDPLVSPAKIIWTNQLSELWVKRLVDDNKKAFLLFNLAATNCTLSVTAPDLGGVSNVAYVVRNVMSNNAVEKIFSDSFSYTIAGTNAVLFTITPMATETVNESTITDHQETVNTWTILNVTGTGVSKQSLASPMGSWTIGDGIYQSGANNFWQWNCFAPTWATNFTVRYRVFCDFSGSVTWTNTTRWYHYADTPGQTPHSGVDSNTVITTGNNTAMWVTNSVNLSVTNFPKEVIVTFGACSNSSARRIIGPAYIKFQ